MRVATIAVAGGSVAVRVDGDLLTEIPGFADAGELLASADWQAIAGLAAGKTYPAVSAEYRQPILSPGKTLCIGLNYRKHILEMGRELPAYPSVFAKFPETLTGPFSDITAIPEDPALDWEGELVLVIGKPAYRVAPDQAANHIAAYTIANDVSMRTYQNRTPEWLQGKMWARSTPVGPMLVSPDEVNLQTAVLRTQVNGETVQEESLSDLLFSPAELVSYLSQIIPLETGDLILTGTPGGVGHASVPPRYLTAGDRVSVEIEGIGRIDNAVVAP